MFKTLKQKAIVAAGAVSVLAAGAANAALDAGLHKAVTDAGTDGATLGGLVLAVVIGIAAFKLLRRAV